MVAKRTTSRAVKRVAKSVTAVGASGGSAVTPLLDTYTGAAAAYSLRKLRTAYTGSAIRVRRSSDSAEQDIGFTAGGDLDESALTTFCGAGDGFVATWYDQAGSNDATQATAGMQPQIVASGVVNAGATGKPAVNFNNVNNNYLSNTSLGPNSQPNSIVAVAERVSPGRFFYDGTTGNRHALFDAAMFAGASASLDATEEQVDAASIHSCVFNSDASVYRRDGVDSSPSTTVGANALEGLLIGSTAAVGAFFNGNYYELIVFPDDRGASLSGIESAINSHYGAY